EARELTVEGTFTANSKPYDGETSATIAENNLTLATKIGDDDVALSAVVAFADKTAAIGKTVSLTETSGLTGVDAENYTLSLVGAPTALAEITAKPLTLVGLTAGNKPYDGNTDAQITSYGTLSGVIEPDVVSLDTGEATASFDTADVGNGKTVTVTGLALAGDDAGNYTIGEQTTTANITGEVASTVPILVVTNAANPFTAYYAEILLAEGMNSFALEDIGNLTLQMLAAYDVVILGEMALTEGQVTMLTDWVTAGGNLIAMRPDKQLAGLLGLVDEDGTLSEGYLLVDTAQRPGLGIVGQTIQYHSAADLYTPAGATAVATLYSNADTATVNPAVTIRNVGGNGGQAAAFTYDLARSVVYTRQGNPNLADTDADGDGIFRPNDLFFPDWVDLNKVAIPQADEQQRLLANMIIHMNSDRKLLPRFWYFPHGHKAAVVMTGDEHGNDGTSARFDQHLAYSDPEGSVEDWQTIRSTSYIYPTANSLPAAAAAGYLAQGFEIGLHLDTGCASPSASELYALFENQLAAWSVQYGNLPAPTTHRNHCIAWSGFTVLPEVGLEFGIRMEASYYYWPGAWAADWPGLFTGSGMPMRFATTDGAAIDVYQAATQMTDESGQVYPYTVDVLLDRALGAEGYYGAFVANIHTDPDPLNEIPSSAELSAAIVSSAISRGVPVISARQLLTWVDARNSSTLQVMGWANDTLTIAVEADAAALGLEAMVPVPDAFDVDSVSHDGDPVAYSLRVVKGIQYAAFPALNGIYEINFVADVTKPAITSVVPEIDAVNVSLSPTISLTFSEAMNPATVNSSTILLRDSLAQPVAATVSYNPANYTVTLVDGPLAFAETYTVTVKSGSEGVRDVAGNTLGGDADFSWSFTTVNQLATSVWDDSAAPAIPSANDAGAVEVGMKFQSAIGGYITGVRFYRGENNPGPHVGHLWNSLNPVTPLAMVEFPTPVEVGWQEASFATPVAIAANTTYVVSYHAPEGGYSVTGEYFTTAGVDNYPLRALSNSESGGNGVFAYGPSGTFPNQSFNAANYWVDVVFEPDTTPPTVVGVSPAGGAVEVSRNAVVTVTFDEAMDAASLTAGTISLSPAPLGTPTVSYDAGTFTATLHPNSLLAAGTEYTVTVQGGEAGVKNLAGLALAADAEWSFTTTEQTSYSIWAETAVPTTAWFEDGGNYELGVVFQSDVAGYVTGLRYYNGQVGSGARTGHLWRRSDQALLGTVEFADPVAVGWQEASFAVPVAIGANTTYVASYYANNGGYAVDTAVQAGNLVAGVTNAPLRALPNGVDGGNGVARVGTGFPNNSTSGVNYWVDVVFALDTTAPTVVGVTPADGATDVSVGAVVTVTFDEAMDPASLTTGTIVLSPAVAGTVSYNALTLTATLTPDAALANATEYTVTVVGGVSGVKDASGNALVADAVWSFTTEAGDTTPPALVSIAESTETPGEFTLEWRVVVGRTYELQWKANLLDTEWTPLDTRTADSTLETFTYDVDAEEVALSGFFRLLDVTP
ncbi:MAG: DUF4082 domain-containing protein, partial [Verrucomicrobiae bacterium]|nr:DUF4082 domain-containing protein [Verrucomicrobiae bacterium]